MRQAGATGVTTTPSVARSSDAPFAMRTRRARRGGKPCTRRRASCAARAAGVGGEPVSPALLEGVAAVRLSPASLVCAMLVRAGTFLLNRQRYTQASLRELAMRSNAAAHAQSVQPCSGHSVRPVLPIRRSLTAALSAGKGVPEYGSVAEFTGFGLQVLAGDYSE